jgi:hypothetical protein
VKRMKFRQAMNIRLVVLTRLGLIVIEYDVKISDNEIANAEVKFRDNSR